MLIDTLIRPRMLGIVFTVVMLAGQWTFASGQRRAPARPQPAPVANYFEVHEQSIVELQAAQTAGKVTSRGLVDSYLARIQAYDQAGPRLNAIVMLNPRAREEADALVARGRAVHVIGGAEKAAELDAKRAIDQGTRLAARL